jgi:hypothetical protein
MNSSALASIAGGPGAAEILGIGAMIAVLVALIVAAVLLAARQHRVCMAAWRSYAASRGARFIESEGPWYRRKGPSIRSQRDGVDFSIDRFVDNSGESGTTYTRIQAACPRAGRTNLTLRYKGFAARIERSMGVRFTAMGDAQFDARFVVRCQEGGALGEIFEPSTRERLLQIDKHFTLTIKDGLAVLRWPGWEMNAAVLDSAVAAIIALCRPRREALEKVGR